MDFSRATARNYVSRQAEEAAECERNTADELLALLKEKEAEISQLRWVHPRESIMRRVFDFLVGGSVLARFDRGVGRDGKERGQAGLYCTNGLLSRRTLLA